MSQYIVDCPSSGSAEPVCTFANWTPPPQVSYYQEYGFSGTTIFWFFVIMAILGLAIIVGTVIVRIEVHDRKKAENVAKINRPVTECPNCMVKIP